MKKMTHIGYAVVLTKAPKGKVPRFATIGSTVLVRSRKQCRHWLKNLKNKRDCIDGKLIPEGERKDGRIVRVRVTEIR